MAPATLLVLSFSLSFALTFAAPSVKLPDDNQLAFNPDIVARVNSDPSAGWVAGYNERLHTLTRRQVRGLLGAFRHPPANAALPRKPSLRQMSPEKREAALRALPKHFDAREKWKHCPTIGTIFDQGHCGSCWAFGAVEALSDRFCIHLNETVVLSFEDLVSCCTECGDGCDGGWPFKAWEFFTKEGVVTDKCLPYFDPGPCKHPGCNPTFPTPKCVSSCSDEELFGTTKHFGASVYAIDSYPEDIMLELFENGPLEVDFDVYEDFEHYKSGVYKHVTGDYAGGHAVKLIGWGTTEEGVDYWLIVNSWNPTWGENGLFRIVRGSNDCGIEEDPVGGLPSSRHLETGGRSATAAF